VQTDPQPLPTHIQGHPRSACSLEDQEWNADSDKCKKNCRVTGLVQEFITVLLVSLVPVPFNHTTFENLAILTIRAWVCLYVST